MPKGGARIEREWENEQCAEERLICPYCESSIDDPWYYDEESVGSMTLMRRYDGEPIVRVELDTSVMLDVSVNGSCGDCVSADVTADAYIEDIKYCPFCGEEL